MNDIAQIAEYPFLPCYAQLISEPSRSYFTFIGDHSYTIYQTRDENGVSFSLTIGNVPSFSVAKHSPMSRRKTFHGLNIVRVRQNVSLPGSRWICIDPVKGLQVFAVPSHEVLFQAQATHAITDGLQQRPLLLCKNRPAIYRITAKELGLYGRRSPAT